MKEELEIRRYTAQGNQKGFFMVLYDSIVSLYQGWGLAYQFAYKTISGQYRESFLGILWAFITPLFSALLWIFLRGSSVINIPDTDLPYPVFVLCGTILWSAFLQAFSAPFVGVKQNQAVMVKLNINRESTILGSVLVNLFNVGIKLIILVGILVFFQVKPDWTMLLALPSIFALLLFGYALGTILIPIKMLFQDVGKAIGLFTGMWMFVTPVIFPGPSSGIGKTVMDLNPVSPLLSVARSCITGTFTSLPYNYWHIVIASVAIILIGLVLFRLSMSIIIERIGS